MRSALAVTLAAMSVLSVGTAACSDDETTAETHVEVGGGPQGIALAGGSVWVADDEGGELLRIDPSTNKVTIRIPVDVDPVHALVVAGDSLWVQGAFSLARIDIESNTVAASVVRNTFSLAFSGGRLFALDDPQLVELDPLSGEEIGEIDVGVIEVLSGPMIADDGALWLSVFDGGREQLAKFSVDEMRIVSMSSVDTPGTLASTGDTIWALERGRALVGFDAATGEIVQRSSLPSGTILDEWPTSLAVADDGTMWAVGQPEQALYQLDPNTGEVIGSEPLKYRPGSIAVDTDSIWTNNAFDERVTRVDRATLVLES